METATVKQRFYGWQLLAFLGLTYAIQIGFGYYSIPVLLPFMTREMGWSRGEVMVGYTAASLLIGISGTLSALLINRLGSRFTLLIGGLIIALAAALLGVAGHIYILYVILCIFIGIGICFATMITIQSVVVSWFNARRAFGLGLVMGGGALGAFLAPQLISNVVLNWQDNWRIGWFIIALFAVVGAVIALITVRNRPSDMGQHPDGLAPQESGVTPRGTPRIIHTHRTRANWTVREAVGTPSLWLLIIATGTCLFLFQVIQSQAPFHLRDRSFSPADAGFFYSLALGFGILGRFSVAALGDRIEPRYLFACATILMLFGGILFWLVSPQSLWIAYLYPLLTGFGFGIAYTCFPTIIGNYWGPKAFPGINGIGQTFIAILQAGAAPASGFLYDLQGTYLTVLVIGCTGAAIAFIAIMLCHPPRSKHKI